MSVSRTFFVMLLTVTFGPVVGAAEPTEGEIERLIVRLGDDRFAVREEASKRLVAIGKPVVSVLERNLSHQDLEVRVRVTEILIEMLNPDDIETTLAVFAAFETIAGEKTPEFLRARKALQERKQWLQSEVLAYFSKLKVKQEQGREFWEMEKKVSTKAISLNGSVMRRGLAAKDLQKLRILTELQTLTLMFLSLNESDLVPLRNMTKLQVLFFSEVGITNRGLRQIKTLTSLHTLGLSGADISDDGLKELKDLRGLRFLSLFKTRISDAGLKYLKEMKELERLTLTKTLITDAGLNSLREFKNLKELRLDGSKVTNDGLKSLKEFNTLRHLSLGSAEITDAGLEHLKVLDGLETLHLYDAGVTAAGVRDLRKSLSKLKVREYVDYRPVKMESGE